jgi:uncharacterized protein YcnI
MKKLALLLFTLILFTACEKTFQIEFTNGSSDTYELYINDVYQQDVEGKQKVTYNIPEGYWSAKVVQKTGYILFPTVKDYSGTYKAGESYYIVFP